MGCLGYFSKRKQTRMPRLEEGVDELGIRHEGDMLTGKLSVEEVLRRAEVKARVAAQQGDEQRAQESLGQQLGSGELRPYIPANMLGREELKGKKAERRAPSLEERVLRRGRTPGKRKS